MKQEHHRLTLRAANELVAFWQAPPVAGAPGVAPALDLDKVGAALGDPTQLTLMERWVAHADDLRDLEVDAGLAAWVVKRVSTATSFQHFAYSGALGDLVDGQTRVTAFDGYCWDCDPYLKWYEEIANASWANVRFHGDPDHLDADVWARSPSASVVDGETDWDNQRYPSALDMAEFYAGQARRLRPAAYEESVQCLCYALHMLQDMSVPQHVTCTIECEHAEYEQDMLDFWKRIFAARSDGQRADVLTHQLAPTVAALLSGPFAACATVREVGQAAVRATAARQDLRVRHAPRRDRAEALQMTALALASTLRALDLA